MSLLVVKKKSTLTYLLLLFSNYWMTLSTILSYTVRGGPYWSIVQNSLYFCAGQERASEHTKDLKTHVILAFFAQRPFATVISPLQLAIHVVQNRRAGEQKSHWDKTNKENYHLKLCMSFVCLVPVRLLLSSVAVLYHVNG